MADSTKTYYVQEGRSAFLNGKNHLEGDELTLDPESADTKWSLTRGDIGTKKPKSAEPEADEEAPSSPTIAALRSAVAELHKNQGAMADRLAALEAKGGTTAPAASGSGAGTGARRPAARTTAPAASGSGTPAATDAGNAGGDSDVPNGTASDGAETTSGAKPGAPHSNAAAGEGQ